MANFNWSLLCWLRDHGHDVVVFTPSGPHVGKFQQHGFKWRSVPLNRSSINVVTELRAIWFLALHLRREKIQIISNFTIKSAVYGTIAALFCKNIRVINTITGFGFVFTSKQKKALLLRPIVTLILKLVMRWERTKTIVLNKHDLEVVEREFAGRNEKNVYLVPGSGVDCNRFFPVYEGHIGSKEGFKICLPARLLWDKGIADYVLASDIVRSKHPLVEFHLCGAIDMDNPSAIPMTVINAWVSNGSVIWEGHVDDMASKLREFNLVVLPSYREGLPTALTEASACGIAIIATDVPGCRDVVRSGFNGFLVPVASPKHIANAIEVLIKDRDLLTRFGRNARSLALDEFSDTRINKLTGEIYFG